MQAAYNRLCDICQVVAGLFDIVDQVDKYQARLGRAEPFGHTIDVAAAKLHLHPVEIVFITQGRFGGLDVIALQGCYDIVQHLLYFVSQLLGLGQR